MATPHSSAQRVHARARHICMLQDPDGLPQRAARHLHDTYCALQWRCQSRRMNSNIAVMVQAVAQSFVDGNCYSAEVGTRIVAEADALFAIIEGCERDDFSVGDAFGTTDGSTAEGVRPRLHASSTFTLLGRPRSRPWSTSHLHFSPVFGRRGPSDRKLSPGRSCRQLSTQPGQTFCLHKLHFLTPISRSASITMAIRSDNPTLLRTGYIAP